MVTPVRLAIEGDNRTDRAFRQVDQGLAGMQRRLGGVTRLARGFVGILIGAGITRAQASLVNTDDKVAKLAKSLGETSEALSAVNFAADRSGLTDRQLLAGTSNLAGAIKQARDELGLGAEAFDMLRINADEFAKLPLSIQLQVLAQQLENIEQASDKIDIAQALFGRRNGLQFLNLLEAGADGLQDLYDEAVRLGNITSAEDALQAEKAVDAMTDLSNALKGFNRVANRTLVPLFTMIVNGLTQVGETGEQAGSSIGKALHAFTTGDFHGAVRALGIEVGNVNAAAGELAETVDDETTPAVEGKAKATDKATAALRSYKDVLDQVITAEEKQAELGNKNPPGSGKDQGPPVPDDRPVGEAFKKILRLRREVDALQFTLSDSLLAAAEEGTDGLLDVWRRTLAQMLADWLASQLLEAVKKFVLPIPGGGGGGGGGIFGGFFNNGGVVPGPMGAPRLVVAHAGETILPTHRGTAGGGLTVNVDARGAAPGVGAEVRAAVGQAVALADRQRRDSIKRGRG